MQKSKNDLRAARVWFNVDLETSGSERIDLTVSVRLA